MKTETDSVPPSRRLSTTSLGGQSDASRSSRASLSFEDMAMLTTKPNSELHRLYGQCCQNGDAGLACVIEGLLKRSGEPVVAPVPMQPVALPPSSVHMPAHVQANPPASLDVHMQTKPGVDVQANPPPADVDAHKQAPGVDVPANPPPAVDAHMQAKPGVDVPANPSHADAHVQATSGVDVPANPPPVGAHMQAKPGVDFLPPAGVHEPPIVKLEPGVVHAPVAQAAPPEVVEIPCNKVNSYTHMSAWKALGRWSMRQSDASELAKSWNKGGETRLQAFGQLIATGQDPAALDAALRFRKTKEETNTDGGRYVDYDRVLAHFKQEKLAADAFCQRRSCEKNGTSFDRNNPSVTTYLLFDDQQRVWTTRTIDSCFIVWRFLFQMISEQGIAHVTCKLRKMWHSKSDATLRLL